ncbi:hypothetical protein VQL36_02840 [Chengkuizengella sp. SCS-71B]|uniref:hypothetical protein n=1 Tax=Chengkuizengella sp. SCS-71B TaxID=3115290 RepID=UPI0032C23A24
MGAALVLVLFILLVIILVAASGGSRYTTNSMEPLQQPLQGFTAQQPTQTAEIEQEESLFLAITDAIGQA